MEAELLLSFVISFFGATNEHAVDEKGKREEICLVDGSLQARDGKTPITIHKCHKSSLELIEAP